MENLTLYKAAAVTLINPYDVGIENEISYRGSELYEGGKESIKLESLTIFEGELYPSFSPDMKEYTLKIDCCTSKITIIPTVVNFKATILINNELLNGNTIKELFLEKNTDSITIEVGDSNKENKTVYTIAIIQIPRLFLNQLDLFYTGERYMMNSAFSLNYSDTTYLRCISQKVTHFTITSYAENKNAVITVANQRLKSKEKSTEIELPDFYNEIEITISEPESVISKSYTLAIIKNYI